MAQLFLPTLENDRQPIMKPELSFAKNEHATQSTLNGKTMYFVSVASVLNYTLLGVINNMHCNELRILKV